MRTRLAAVFLVLIGLLSPALAQKTKSIMSTELSTQLPDNTSGAITPSVLRTVLGDMVNSWQQYGGVNAQVGVNYTFQASDYGQLVTFSNAAPVAVTLPQAAGSFQYFSVYAVNNGAGTVTITPAASTIDGAASLTLLTGQGVLIVSDQANYQIFKQLVNVSQVIGNLAVSHLNSGTNAVDNTFWRGDGTWSSSLNPTNIAVRFGSMDIWQRGAGQSASISVGGSSTAYTVDGCYLNTSATQASLVQSFAGIAAGSWRSANIQRQVGQTGTGRMTFGCPFETDEAAMFAGQFVTLSFTATVANNWSAGNGTLAWGVICGTGSPKKETTGYTNETFVISSSNNITTPANVTRYQATSAAIAPANCTQAEIQFVWNPTGTAAVGDSITIDDVQLEVVNSATSVASTFRRENFSGQLYRALRHYTKTFPYTVTPAQSVSTTNNTPLYMQNYVAAVPTATQWQFPLQMRSTPTITTYNPGAANANCRDVPGAADRVVTVDPGTTINNKSVVIQCAAGGAAGTSVYVHAAADAGI